MAHNIVAIHFLDLPVDMMAKVCLYENYTFVIYIDFQKCTYTNYWTKLIRPLLFGSIHFLSVLSNCVAFLHNSPILGCIDGQLIYSFLAFVPWRIFKLYEHMV